MTVKDLKLELEKLPENSTVFFTIWTSKGAKHFIGNNPLGKRVYENKKTGKIYSMIFYADDCLADRISEQEINN